MHDLLNETSVSGTLGSKIIEPIVQFNATQGYYLEELHIMNFGSYHGIREFDYDGQSAAHVGGNGSGKTTALDGFRWLLRDKPNFNAASGSDEKSDRNIEQYCKGVTGGKDDSAKKITKVTVLRPFEEEKHTIVLAQMKNGRGKKITLARMIKYNKIGTNKTEFFVVSDKPLSIKKCFKDWRTQAKLFSYGEESDFDVYTSFASYIKRVNSIFGIDDEAGSRAWRLWEAAISARDVKSLTLFMRDLVMRPSKLKKEVDALIESTKTLKNIYQKAEDATDKISRMVPICKTFGRLEDFLIEQKMLNKTKISVKALKNFVSSKHLKKFMKIAQIDLDNKNKEIEQLEAEISLLDGEINTLELKIANVVDAESERLKEERKHIFKELNSLAMKCMSLSGMLDKFGINDVNMDTKTLSQNEWDDVRHRLKIKADKENDKLPSFEKNYEDSSLAYEEAKLLYSSVETEYNSVNDQQSNIDYKLLKIRDNISRDLNISKEQLPFAGELIQVKESQRDIWEKSINSVLKGFAQNLMIPAEFYKSVTKYVNYNDMKALINFIEVDKSARHFDENNVTPGTILDKIDIMDVAYFSDEVTKVIAKRFNYRCVDGDIFGATSDGGKYVTPEGLYKAGNRNTKDDRPASKSHQNFVLGWSADDKLASLADKKRSAYEDLQVKSKVKETAKLAHYDHTSSIQVLNKFIEDLPDSFSSYDVATIEEKLNSIDFQIDILDQKNTDDKDFKKDLIEVKERKSGMNLNVKELIQDAAGLSREVTIAQERLDTSQSFLIHEGYIDASFNVINHVQYVVIKKISDVYLQEFKRLSGSKDMRSSQALNLLLKESKYHEANSKWDELDRILDEEVKRLAHRISQAQSEIRKDTDAYLNKHAEDYDRLYSSDLVMDESSHLRQSWRDWLNRLETQGLPELRERFRIEMQERTVELFTTIERGTQEENDEYRIITRGINSTLENAVYDPENGSKIKFHIQGIDDPRVKTFKNLLKAAMDSFVTTDDLDVRYQAIMNFVKKYQDTAEASQTKIRNLVLDTRNWNSFKAETYIGSGDNIRSLSVFEGSQGASGGQQMRLALTAMTAGLGYVFGVFDPERAETAFKVFMMDEAFEKFHLNSTRASMQTIQKEFGMQVILATPDSQINALSRYITWIFETKLKQSSKTSVVMVMKISEILQEMQDSDIKKIKTQFKDKGYSEEKLDTIIDKILKKNEKTLLQKQRREEDEIRETDAKMEIVAKSGEFNDNDFVTAGVGVE